MKQENHLDPLRCAAKPCRNAPAIAGRGGFDRLAFSPNCAARQEKTTTDFFQISFVKANGLVRQRVAFKSVAREKNSVLLPANSFLPYAPDAAEPTRETSAVVVAQERSSDGIAVGSPENE